MTPTDELRAMLDERGVDWWAEDDPEEPAYYFITKWFANGCEQTYKEIPAIRSKALKAYCVTPEQAIAATLGAGTCHIVERNGDLYCDACGEMVGTFDTESELFIDGNAVELWEFCPRCRRRVVK